MRDLRSLRMERDWKLLHAFNPLYTDIDTMLGYAQVFLSRVLSGAPPPRGDATYTTKTTKKKK
jgi:hypothetical protein